MKRLLSLSLVALFFLSSCRGSDSPKKVIPLTIWTVGSEGNKVTLIAQDFERANPDVNIRIIKMDWEVARDRILGAISDGGTPDLCQVGTTWMPEFASTGTLLPLDDWVFRSSIISKEKFFNGPWQTNVINGKLYGIPWYLETRFLFYRKDLLQENGFSKPPRTWEELETIAAALTQDVDQDGKIDRYGLSLTYFDSKTVVPFIWQNGGTLLNASLTRTTLCDKAEKEALKFYINLFRKGYVLPREENPEDAFIEGKSAMTLAGPWYITILRKRLPEKDYLWGMTTVPKKKYGTSFFGGSNFVIFNSSKYKEAAWRFLEFLSRPENQASWFQAVSALPTVKDAWLEPTAFTHPRYMSIFKSQLRDVKTFPPIPQIEIFTTALEKHIVHAIDSKETLDPLLDQMCQDLDRLLAP